MNSAVRKVKTYACKNATNNSSKLKAVTPSTLAKVIPPHSASPVSVLAAMTMKNKIIANTV